MQARYTGPFKAARPPLSTTPYKHPVGDHVSPYIERPKATPCGSTVGGCAVAPSVAHPNWDSPSESAPSAWVSKPDLYGGPRCPWVLPLGEGTGRTPALILHRLNVLAKGVLSLVAK